ncbi:hypothetical protein [Flavobacterium sp.]|jgi:hypothetical protein|uniref:hypothetical protein n=1 Tax=Flavobacterium sp. TaxID=239 RepID=UPI0037C11DE4
MSKIKQKSYGFTTPIRRSTNNVTGHKVGGKLSGGDCKIVRFNRLVINQNRSVKIIYQDEPINLFQRDISIFGIGGYFISDSELDIEIKITALEVVTKKVFNLQEGVYQKIGLEIEFNIDSIDDNCQIEVEINISTNEQANLQYTNLGMGYISYEYFKENDVYSHFYNSKKEICYPEQFYFDEEIILDESIDGDLTIIKSCNRCQRFLPINHINERVQLAFSNHCSAKAPCTHGNFSNYQIKESAVIGKDLEDFISTTPYTLKDDFIYSYYGHQLECKSCKKFFVNAALNHLRTSTQHREDSLRRRSFELLTRKLLSLKWIYHIFLEEQKVEFDKFIWEKFDKSCFNCGKEIKTSNEMDLDHTMPLAYLYPLDETATCLCSTCNSSKSDHFPVDFYTPEKLVQLSKITGLSLELLQSKRSNEKVIIELKENIVWFFEEFLTFEEYTKVREGKTVANSILHSLQKVVNKSSIPFDLIKEYEIRKH